MPTSRRGAGFWALTRFDDLVEASRNPRMFTSGSGATSIAETARRSSASSSAR